MNDVTKPPEMFILYSYQKKNNLPHQLFHVSFSTVFVKSLYQNRRFDSFLTFTKKHLEHLKGPSTPIKESL